MTGFFILSSMTDSSFPYIIQQFRQKKQTILRNQYAAKACSIFCIFYFLLSAPNAEVNYFHYKLWQLKSIITNRVQETMIFLPSHLGWYFLHFLRREISLHRSHASSATYRMLKNLIRQKCTFLGNRIRTSYFLVLHNLV